MRCWYAIRDLENEISKKTVQRCMDRECENKIYYTPHSRLDSSHGLNHLKIDPFNFLHIRLTRQTPVIHQVS